MLKFINALIKTLYRFKFYLMKRKGIDYIKIIVVKTSEDIGAIDVEITTSLDLDEQCENVCVWVKNVSKAISDNVMKLCKKDK